MAGKKINTGISVGSSSILVIFVVLCLTTFATLSLVSANADYRLTLRVADETADYYAADAQAEELLMQIDQSMDLSYATAQIYAQYQKSFGDSLKDAAAQFFGETLQTGNWWLDGFFGAISDFIAADPQKGGETAAEPFPYSDILPDGLTQREAYSVLLRHILTSELEGVTIADMDENPAAPVLILEYQVPVSESRVLQVRVDASQRYYREGGKLERLEWAVASVQEWEEPEMPGLMTGLPQMEEDGASS